MAAGGPRPPAVVLGGAANAVSVARTLARAGVAVHTLADSPDPAPVRWSRAAREHVPYPGREGGAGDDLGAHWTAWFAAAAGDPTGPGPAGAVVLPCGDLGLDYIARHRAELEAGGYRPVEADDALLLAMLDKARTYELAARAGVAVPKHTRLDAADELGRAAEGVTYPVALKPVHAHEYRRPGKAVVVRSRAELEAAWKSLAPLGIGMLLTEIIPGPDDAYCSYNAYLDEHGDPLAAITKRKLRQQPIGFGNGTYHVTADEPDAARIGLALFRALGVRGVANVEFKRDARDGELKLIECNLRITAAHDQLRRAGVDFARIAYRRAAGLPVPAPGPVRQGVRLWFPGEDVRAFLQYRAAGQLTTRAWLRSLDLPLHTPLADVWDPLPSAAAVLALLRRLARQVARRLAPRRAEARTDPTAPSSRA
jgi:D-aspartate ligase